MWQPAPFSLPNPLQEQQVLAGNYAGANGLISLSGHASWQHATEVGAQSDMGGRAASFLFPDGQV